MKTISATMLLLGTLFIPTASADPPFPCTLHSIEYDVQGPDTVRYWMDCPGADYRPTCSTDPDAILIQSEEWCKLQCYALTGDERCAPTRS